MAEYNVVFVLGGPGAGKGTQCESIVKVILICLSGLAVVCKCRLTYRNHLPVSISPFDHHSLMCNRTMCSLACPKK